jgi:pyridoxal phosphate enzyme (YggS family)
VELKERLDQVLAEVARHCEACGRDPATVDLLPISKKHPPARIREVFSLGRKALGENRVQELARKAAELEGLDIQWHMVGSLQTNKVKQLLQVPHLALLQSLDRMSLAEALQKALAGSGRRLPVLLQVNATDEDSKHGCRPAGAAGLVSHVQRGCPSLELCGVMAMGPLLGDPEPVFGRVAALRADLQQSTGLGLPILSMGMTDDMAAAIAAGSTMVRVGTGVFGPRG